VRIAAIATAKSGSKEVAESPAAQALLAQATGKISEVTFTIVIKYLSGSEFPQVSS